MAKRITKNQKLSDKLLEIGETKVESPNIVGKMVRVLTELNDEGILLAMEDAFCIGEGDDSEERPKNSRKFI